MKIQLTKGMSTDVDDADYDRLAAYNWYFDNEYPKNSQLGKMHNAIMNPPLGMVVDHIDGNPLNNRKSNLRICTQVNNGKNRKPQKGGTSAYKGVHYHIQRKKWVARITSDRKHVHIGVFDDEISAAKAYDERAILLHGEYARLNFN